MRDLLQQPAGKAAAALIRRDAVEKSISRSRAMRRPSLAPLTLSSSTSNKKKMNTQTHTQEKEREREKERKCDFINKRADMSPAPIVGACIFA